MDDRGKAFQPGSSAVGTSCTMEKQGSEESAGLASYTEGEEDDEEEDMEEGTLDDIDEDDDAHASANWHVSGLNSKMK